MSKGYITIAQNSGNTDYLRMAYALALSIKNTQTTVKNVCLATDIPINKIDTKIKNAFTDIVPIPWGDDATNSEWKLDNTWKFFYMTPYDETVILDADMLFPKDISHWWDILSTQDVWSVNKPRTFKGDLITSTRYRKVFESNNLPNFHMAFTYFKKSRLAAELFRMVDIIFHNWEKFFIEYLDETRPMHNSGDVAYALAIKLLGIENECFGHNSFVPSFVHMKSYLQNIDNTLLTENWTKHLPTYFREDCGFKIGNYEQTLPFHYHIKEWLTEDILKKLEKRAGIV